MAAEERVELRRSARLALTEIHLNETSHETPNKNVSADELVIVQRGPRRKPITWSPIEQNESAEKKVAAVANVASPGPRRPCLNPKLRRRLILSPTKNSSELGTAIARKLRTLPHLFPELSEKTEEPTTVA